MADSIHGELCPSAAGKRGDCRFDYGDPVQGLIIGSAINLPFIGVIMVGSTMPTDSALAGIVGTALALASGASPRLQYPWRYRLVFWEICFGRYT